MKPLATDQPSSHPQRTMPGHAARTTIAALSILALGGLGGCSSGTEAGSVEDVQAEETAPPAPTGEDGGAQESSVDESAPGEVPTDDSASTNVIRYSVGDNFTAGDEFFGIFDITYRGIANMGQLDDGEGTITCYAVLIEATLQEMPANNEDPEVGSFTHEVLDPAGEKAADNFSSECSDAILADNGYPSKYDIEWVPGTATKVTVEKLTVPDADIDSADSVDIDPLGEYVLDFEIVENW